MNTLNPIANSASPFGSINTTQRPRASHASQLCTHTWFGPPGSKPQRRELSLSCMLCERPEVEFLRSPVTKQRKVNTWLAYPATRNGEPWLVRKGEAQEQERRLALKSRIWNDFCDNGARAWGSDYNEMCFRNRPAFPPPEAGNGWQEQSLSSPLKLWTTLPSSDFPYCFFPLLSISIKGVKRDSPNPHCHYSEKRNLPTPLQPI